MWYKVIFFIGIIFIIVGIIKNKQREYIKKSAFSVIVISMLFSMSLLSLGKVYALFNFSMLTTFIALIAYIFSDYED